MKLEDLKEDVRTERRAEVLIRKLILRQFKEMYNPAISNTNVDKKQIR